MQGDNYQKAVVDHATHNAVKWQENWDANLILTW